MQDMDWYWKITKWMELTGLVICLLGTTLLVIAALYAPNFHWSYMLIVLVPLFVFGFGRLVAKPILLRAISRANAASGSEYETVFKWHVVMRSIGYFGSVFTFLALSCSPYLMILRAFGRY